MWKCMVECEWKDIKLSNKIVITNELTISASSSGTEIKQINDD